MREIPHQTVVGSLDDVAGIMRSVQDLGVQAISPPGPDIYCRCPCVLTTPGIHVKIYGLSLHVPSS